jgi:hypothetical protein
VLIESAGAYTLSENARCAVCEPESVTLMVTLNVPKFEVVPEITPPDDSPIPVGSEPVTIEYVYGVVPPVETSAVEYAVPDCAFGSEVVLSSSGAGLTVTEYCCVAICDPESVAFTVKVLEPAVVGVPEKTPEVFIVTPAGSVPAEIVQVTGAVPPLNVIDAL